METFKEITFSVIEQMITDYEERITACKMSANRNKEFWEFRKANECLKRAGDLQEELNILRAIQNNEINVSEIVTSCRWSNHEFVTELVDKIMDQVG